MISYCKTVHKNTMARVIFSSMVEEIVGKLAGSVFQDSYGGFQIRTRVSPRNPQSTYQQLRRGEFGFLSSSWRNLTSIERQTFIDNAPSPGASLNFFLQTNVNLSLINEAIVTTYVPGTTPDPMQIDLLSANNFAMILQASGAITTVPAGTKLLVQITARKPETRIFTNPSEYSPVVTFDEGTDLSVQQNVISDWQARYGQMQATGRVALKASLIDKANGSRGAESLSTATIEQGPVKMYFDSPPVVGGFNCPAGLVKFCFDDGTIGVGHAVYYDSGLTVPVTGFNRYSQDLTFICFTLNPATGVATGVAGLCV